MTARVPITRPVLGREEVEAAARVIHSGWLTQGAEVDAFEKEFAKTVQAAHAVAVANCTVALELALRVTGVGPGHDVVTVSHSFIATANAVVAVGARPVFVDVEADSFGMSAERLSAAITPKTRAIMCVHQLGFPCDLDGILRVAARAGLPVVEDAACAIGSEIRVGDRWERIGKPHGLLACFSFHPRKIITTGDGGMLTTSDDALATRLRLLRQHAMSVPDTVRHQADRVVFEEYVEPAFNYRLTDLQAAVGRPQLARLAAIVEERRARAARYVLALADHPDLRAPVERDGTRNNWQSFPVSVRGAAPGSQLALLEHLLSRGVAGKRGVSNAHQEPAYRGTDRFGCGPEPCASHAEGCLRLPVSEKARDTTVLVPLFHGMTDDEETRVLGALHDFRAGPRS